MKPDNHFRFFAGMDGDAQVTLAISIIGVIFWAATLHANIRWLKRANGERPFVHMALFVNVVFFLSALNYLIGSAYLQSISDDSVLRGSFWFGRVLIGIVAPCGTWRLRREIDRRSGH